MQSQRVNLLNHCLLCTKLFALSKQFRIMHNEWQSRSQWLTLPIAMQSYVQRLWVHNHIAILVHQHAVARQSVVVLKKGFGQFWHWVLQATALFWQHMALLVTGHIQQQACGAPEQHRSKQARFHKQHLVQISNPCLCCYTEHAGESRQHSLKWANQCTDHGQGLLATQKNASKGGLTSRVACSTGSQSCVQLDSTCQSQISTRAHVHDENCIDDAPQHVCCITGAGMQFQCLLCGWQCSTCLALSHYRH